MVNHTEETKNICKDAQEQVFCNANWSNKQIFLKQFCIFRSEKTYYLVFKSVENKNPEHFYII